MGIRALLLRHKKENLGGKGASNSGAVSTGYGAERGQCGGGGPGKAPKLATRPTGVLQCPRTSETGVREAHPPWFGICAGSQNSVGKEG